MNKQDRYKQMEKIMTIVLLTALVMFILFLISSGCGIIWLKVMTCIITVLLCGLSIAFLYMTKLLLKPRSFWMTISAAAILVCLFFSLILNYPSPV